MEDPSVGLAPVDSLIAFNLSHYPGVDSAVFVARISVDAEQGTPKGFAYLVHSSESDTLAEVSTTSGGFVDLYSENIVDQLPTQNSTLTVAVDGTSGSTVGIGRALLLLYRG